MKKYIIKAQDGEQYTVEAQRLERSAGWLSFYKEVTASLEDEPVASFALRQMAAFWVEGEVESEKDKLISPEQMAVFTDEELEKFQELHAKLLNAAQSKH